MLAGFAKSICGQAQIMEGLLPSMEYHKRISTSALYTYTGNKKRQPNNGIKYSKVNNILRFYILHNGTLFVASLFHNGWTKLHSPEATR